MNTNFHIRKATLKDCEACYALSVGPELATPLKDSPPLYWFKGIVKENQLLLVAEYDKEIQGYVMGERITCNWALLHLIAVRATERNKGMGKALISAFEKECKKRKLKGILTYVHTNERSRGFFKKRKYILGSNVVEGIKILNMKGQER